MDSLNRELDWRQDDFTDRIHDQDIWSVKKPYILKTIFRK